MCKLYADENVPKAVVSVLCNLGYDVLTAYEAGQANQGIEDAALLAFAAHRQRVVLTLNRRDFLELHQNSQNHFGIVICREDRNYSQLAQRIHNQIVANKPLQGKLIRVNKQ